MLLVRSKQESVVYIVLYCESDTLIVQVHTKPSVEFSPRGGGRRGGGCQVAGI